jgi:ribosomal protein S18 acetylase RimI-like enzyme
MLVDNRKIGCCAFEEHIPPGTLYLASTGILPAYRGQGYGQIMKAWQIVYAKRHGFTRIVTNARQSNAAIIALNRKFGFRTVRKVPGYYISPDESAVVMNLKLPPQIDRIVRPAP